jgi:hypothetical protein
MKTRIFITVLVSSFLFLTSCNKEEVTDNPQITQDDITTSAKIDASVDDLSAIILEEFSDEIGIAAKTNASQKTASCATVTRNPAYGNAITPGTTVTKTINFGDGCTLPNGNVLKGKIIISFIYQPDATSHTITYTFENFYHNGLKFNGTKTITVTIGTSNANPDTHPIFTFNLDLTITLPSGRIVKVNGTRTREIIEGYDTPELTDNVYQITGNWQTTFPSGATRTATITSPLIVKLNCPSIVKGIITYSRNGETSTLDFGDGTCDNTATFTINGVPYTIILRN